MLYLPHKDVTSFCDFHLPKCEFLGPYALFATQSTQECHSPSQVGGIRLFPLGRPLCMLIITKRVKATEADPV